MQLLVAVLVLAASVCCGLLAAESEGPSSTACVADRGQPCGDPGRQSQTYPWPSKGGNCNHSGHSSQHSGPFDLASGLIWSHPAASVALTSPLIDADGNVYTTDSSGLVTALSRIGEVLWTYQMAMHPGVPTLYEGALYTCGSDGIAVALDMATGALRWSSRIGTACPTDTWAAVASQGFVVMPADVLSFDYAKGNCEFVAINASDGRVTWAHNMCVSVGVRSLNFMASIVAGRVIFHDQAGGVHCVTLDRGKLLWTSPADSTTTISSGGLVVAPNEMVYCGFNYKGHADAGQGMVRAHSIHDGSVLWKRAFDHSVNVVPAVGVVHGHSDLAVVVAVGDNFMPALPFWKMMLLLQRWIPRSLTDLLLLDYYFPAKLVAMAADTGFLIWTFNIGVKRGWAYPGTERGCLVDAFGSPSIGSDGTTYLNWSAGCAFAIRDANSDGSIHGEDPREVSRFCHGHGTNSQSSIGPGIFVLATCEGVFGYEA